MSQLKCQVNLLSRFFSILPTHFKNMVSRKTRLKFGNTTKLCIVDSHLICNTRTIISHILKMQKISKKNRFFENFTQVDPLNDIIMQNFRFFYKYSSAILPLNSFKVVIRGLFDKTVQIKRDDATGPYRGYF